MMREYSKTMRGLPGFIVWNILSYKERYGFDSIDPGEHRLRSKTAAQNTNNAATTCWLPLSNFHEII